MAILKGTVDNDDSFLTSHPQCILTRPLLSLQPAYQDSYQRSNVTLILSDSNWCCRHRVQVGECDVHRCESACTDGTPNGQNRKGGGLRDPCSEDCAALDLPAWRGVTSTFPGPFFQSHLGGLLWLL